MSTRHWAQRVSAFEVPSDSSFVTQACALCSDPLPELIVSVDDAPGSPGAMRVTFVAHKECFLLLTQAVSDDLKARP